MNIYILLYLHITMLEIHYRYFYINKSNTNFIIISIYIFFFIFIIHNYNKNEKKKIFSICASLSLCASSSECFCLISLAVDEPIIEAVHIRKYTASRQHICMFLYVYSSLEYIHTYTQEKKAVDGIRMEESADQQRTLMRKKAIDFDWLDYRFDNVFFFL